MLGKKVCVKGRCVFREGVCAGKYVCWEGMCGGKMCVQGKCVCREGVCAGKACVEGWYV